MGQGEGRTHGRGVCIKDEKALDLELVLFVDPVYYCSIAYITLRNFKFSLADSSLSFLVSSLLYSSSIPYITLIFFLFLLGYASPEL